jgi:hypothetical protein
MFLCAVSGLLFLNSPAFGQASVEYGMGAANAAGSAGALKGLGDTINAALGNPEKTIAPPTTTVIVPATPTKTAAPATKSKPGARSSKSAAIAAAPPAPKPVYEDPRQIEVGMKYDELIRRFGPPAMAITNGADSRTFTYMSKAGPVQVEYADEKVTAADKPKS